MRLTLLFTNHEHQINYPHNRATLGPQLVDRWQFIGRLRNKRENEVLFRWKDWSAFHFFFRIGFYFACTKNTEKNNYISLCAVPTVRNRVNDRTMCICVPTRNNKNATVAWRPTQIHTDGCMHSALRFFANSRIFLFSFHANAVRYMPFDEEKSTLQRPGRRTGALELDWLRFGIRKKNWRSPGR